MTVELAPVRQPGPAPAEPVAGPPQGAGHVDVASEWAAVAEVAAASGVTTPSTGHRTADDADGSVVGHVAADLGTAMRSFAARRDLRRILIAFGAIGKVRPDGGAAKPARPEDVVGAFITATPEILNGVLTAAGAVQDPDRIARFITGIVAAGQRCDPADAAAVERWIGEVATILRDQG